MEFKKFVCLMLAAALVAGGIVFVASQATKTTDIGYPELNKSPYEYKNQEESLAEVVNVEELKQYLLEFIMKAEAKIDVADFRVPAHLHSNILDLIWYGMPEAFNTEGVRVVILGGIITDVVVYYREFADTASEYEKCFENFKAAADGLLEGIEGNEKLSDEYKALLLHDRLCMHTQYCYEDLLIEEHTAYGALVNRSAVCQGYAMAYMYLLRRAGIDNYYCASKRLDHAWNIVYINDLPYHVDVTMDDMDWGKNGKTVAGGVRHDNFLRSTDGLYDSDHEADDYDNTPQDTSFDEFFWQESETEFCLAEGKVYYINNKTGKLICATDDKEISDIGGVWYADNAVHWSGNYSRLSSYDDKLLYSLADGVYRYAIADGETEKVYSPKLQQGFNVFGFSFEDGYIICDINNEPPGGNTSQLYTETVRADNSAAVMTGFEISEVNEVYYIGDSFDSDTIVIKAVFSDGSKEILTGNFEISGFSSDEAGIKTVTVIYNSFSVQLKVTVKAPRITVRDTAVSLYDNEAVIPLISTEPAGQVLSWDSKNGIAIAKDGKITASAPGNDVVSVGFTYNGIVYREDIAVTVLCSHTNKSEHNEIPATAEKTGYTKGIYCNDCKKYISGHIEIPKLEMIFDDSEKAVADGNIIKTVAGTDVSELIALSPEGSYIKNASGKKQDNKAMAGTGYILVFPDSSEYTIISCGDIDGDGILTAADARLALRAAVGLESYDKSSPFYIAARVESADTVSASDARKILRGSVGLEKPEEWLK